MDNSSTSSGSPRVHPLILVVHQQIQELERMVRSGILSVPSQLEFCEGRHQDVIRHIELDRPGLLIAPLQLQDVNAALLEQEIIKKTGVPMPAIFITDPAHLEVQRQLLRLGAFDFVSPDFEMADLLGKVERVMRLAPKRQESRLEAFVGQGDPSAASEESE
jgi:FixJ family two-component response regulator